MNNNTDDAPIPILTTECSVCAGFGWLADEDDDCEACEGTGERLWPMTLAGWDAP